MIRSALKDAALSPSRLSQVETHGIGAELGDPIETGALRSVLPRIRLGAVKTNVGHLEGGAGMVGLGDALWAQVGCVSNQYIYITNLFFHYYVSLIIKPYFRELSFGCV